MADHIFICYAREDEEFVLPLAKNLKRQGIPIWLDQWNIPAGADWDRSIDNAICECAKFVIVLSNPAVDSSEVRGELRTAIDEKKPIIPVIRAPCRVPRQLRTIQHVDFSSRGADDETALRQLVRTLETSTARVTEEAAEIGGSPGFPPSQPPKTEKTWFQNRLAALRSGYRHATFVLNNRYAVAIVGIIIGFVVWWQWPRRQESGVVPPPAPQPAQTAYTTTIREARGGLIVPQMVEIPAGNFRRGDIQGGGDKNELPVRSVQIKRRFAIGRYEVTFEEYDQFAADTRKQLPDDSGWGRGRRPVISVSWQDAQDYAEWLSKKTGKRYRLPTEAEWEYAARSGGKEEKWSGTSREEELRDIAWYSTNSGGKTQEVGGKKPNGYGIFDMSGNVWEWVEDCYHKNYEGAPTDGSAWLQAGGGDCRRRVVRGGSWYNAPGYLRSSSRFGLDAGNWTSTIGFRLARDIS